MYNTGKNADFRDKFLVRWDVPESNGICPNCFPAL